ncbi:MAG TPA: hypothetical protein VFE06_10700 [Acidobacteriaceae bacterium]|jgi:alpha-L-fucosidase 2|nr:hypothetical protein [Acidobacteriaceae bacterium]
MATLVGQRGVAEIFLRSQGNKLHLLPALPPAWSAGSVRGLRARGGITVSIFWHNGALTRAMLTAAHGRGCAVRI